LETLLNNLKFWEQKTKVPKQDNQNQLSSPMPEPEEGEFLSEKSLKIPKV
jgi:hypothetical protein